MGCVGCCLLIAGYSIPGLQADGRQSHGIGVPRLAQPGALDSMHEACIVRCAQVDLLQPLQADMPLLAEATPWLDGLVHCQVIVEAPACMQQQDMTAGRLTAIAQTLPQGLAGQWLSEEEAAGQAVLCSAQQNAQHCCQLDRLSTTD